MEASQPLATESFSYSWLSNVRPTLDGLDRPFRASLDSSHAATSKELEYYKMIKSKRCSEESRTLISKFPHPNLFLFLLLMLMSFFSMASLNLQYLSTHQGP
ncbi:hypothetical protein SLA2020_318410 [Shorea laevis]